MPKFFSIISKLRSKSEFRHGCRHYFRHRFRYEFMGGLGLRLGFDVGNITPEQELPMGRGRKVAERREKSSIQDCHEKGIAMSVII